MNLYPLIPFAPRTMEEECPINKMLSLHELLFDSHFGRERDGVLWIPENGRASPSILHQMCKENLSYPAPR